MHESGDTLLFALSALRRWSWTAYKSAFDQVRERRAARIEAPDHSSRFERWQCATLLDSLGHCDFTFNEGTGQLISAPAVLASLPVAGLPRAILCGARSPDTLPALYRHAEMFGGSVHVTSASQRPARSYAPTRIEIEADDLSGMARFAEDVGIRFARVPPAWPLALRAGDLRGYISRLTWSDDPEIGWVREDFEPCPGRFGPPRETPERVSRYQDPIRGVWRYRLVRGTSSAEVDPSWGRWAALQWASRSVLDYNSTTGLLKVPASIPLPRVMARAVVLCSGRAPRLARASARKPLTEAAGSDAAIWVEIYEAVPADVFELIATKLGQPQRTAVKGDT